jgi:hypothetical protein
LHDVTETTTILPGFDPANLIGREYIDLPVEDGIQHKICILRVTADHIDDLAKQPAQTKFLVSSQTGNHDKTSSYNEIIDHLNGKFTDDNDFNIEHQYYSRFKDITVHQGPLNSTDHNYKGSK